MERRCKYPPPINEVSLDEKGKLTPYSNDDERPRAYVVLKPGHSATDEDIVKFMDDKVSRIKRITGGVAFLDAIPKNPSGKIMRKVLRDWASKEQNISAKL